MYRCPVPALNRLFSGFFPGYVALLFPFSVTPPYFWGESGRVIRLVVTRLFPALFPCALLVRSFARFFLRFLSLEHWPFSLVGPLCPLPSF